MAKHGHRLPSVLEPVGDICVQVTIPAHPDYVALFVRAVRMLETNRLYERDEALSAKIVVNQWRTRTVTPLIEALAEGTGICQDLDGECLTYPPFANFISYIPQNPFTEPDLVPDGFLIPPFYVVGTDGHDLPNYKDGDVLLAFDAISLELSWELEKTPRIEICLEGSGVIELHLLKIVQGGVAAISVDNPLDLGDIISGIVGEGIELISLNQDIVSLPPETAEEVIIELDIPTDGEHTVYIYFLPTVDDSLIPLFFGGGIREISLCGNLRPCGVPAPEPPPPLEGVTELKPEFQFTTECGLEYRLRNQDDEIVSDWQAVAGWVENFADCVIGANSMATKEDIRDAIYEAVNRLSAQLVSGRYTDILIGDDGTVSNPTDTDGGAELPEDDPATPNLNENYAARSGGVRKVTDGLQKILTDMFTWFAGYTAPSTGVIPQMAEDRLVNLYQFEADAANTFVNYWYTVYMNSSGAVTLNEAVLDGFFFCRGVSIQTLAHYVYNLHATAAEVPVLEVFLENMPLVQMQEWFNDGVSVPSGDYYLYSCLPIESETFSLDMSLSNTPSVTSVQNLKQNHRYRFRVSGKFTDSDVADVERDYFYKKVISTGVVTLENTNAFNSSGIANVTSSQVPYRADGIYDVIVDKTGANSGVVIARDNGADFNLPNVSGTIAIIMDDLGEYGL